MSEADWRRPVGGWPPGDRRPQHRGVRALLPAARARRDRHDPREQHRPAHDMPQLAEEGFAEQRGARRSASTVVIKLNGGLGTSMGMERPKSLLRVRHGLTFLDIIARQVLALRSRYDVTLPLLLHELASAPRVDTAGILAALPGPGGRRAAAGLPAEQGAQAAADDLDPGRLAGGPRAGVVPARPRRRLHRAASTGLLDALRERGIRYVFVSNSDNLGATCAADARRWLVRRTRCPFADRGVRRTRRDRKGGHLGAPQDRRADRAARERAWSSRRTRSASATSTGIPPSLANNLWFDLEVMASPSTSATASSGCRSSATARPSTRATRHRPGSSRSSRRWVRRSRSSRARTARLGREPVRAGEDHQRAAAHPLRRLRPGHRLAIVQTTDAPEPFVDLDGHFTLVGEFEKRFPDGVPSMREARRSGSRATGRSAPTWCASATCWCRPTSPPRIADGTRLGGEG